MTLMHCSLFGDGETNMTTQVKVTARAGQVWSDGHTHYTIDALQATGHGTVWDNGTDGRWVLVQDVLTQETPNYHYFGAAGDHCDKCGIAARTVMFGGAEVQRCPVKPTEPVVRIVADPCAQLVASLPVSSAPFTSMRPAAGQFAAVRQKMTPMLQVWPVCPVSGVELRREVVRTGEALEGFWECPHCGE